MAAPCGSSMSDSLRFWVAGRRSAGNRWSLIGSYWPASALTGSGRTGVSQFFRGGLFMEAQLVPPSSFGGGDITMTSFHNWVELSEMGCVMCFVRCAFLCCCGMVFLTSNRFSIDTSTASRARLQLDHCFFQVALNALYVCIAPDARMRSTALHRY